MLNKCYIHNCQDAFFLSHGKNRVAAVDDGVVMTVTTRVEGIRHLLINEPTE